MNDNSRLVGRFVSVPDGTARANQCCPSWWSWHAASHEPTNLDLGFTGVGGMKVGGGTGVGGLSTQSIKATD